MLHTEFEKLTGLSVDIDQYEVINGMYMCQENQTKQEFCKSFVEMGLMSHVKYVVGLKKDKDEMMKKLDAASKHVITLIEQLELAKEVYVENSRKLERIEEILKNN